MQKRLLVPSRVRRVPRQFSWVDQRLVRDNHRYNHNRPHSALHGKTPHEVYHDLLPACERPRYEPRAN